MPSFFDLIYLFRDRSRIRIHNLQLSYPTRGQISICPTGDANVKKERGFVSLLPYLLDIIPSPSTEYSLRNDNASSSP